MIQMLSIVELRPDFNQGYIDGFCHVSPNSGSDADEAKFDCSHASGQSNAIIRKALTRGHNFHNTETMERCI